MFASSLVMPTSGAEWGCQTEMRILSKTFQDVAEQNVFEEAGFNEYAGTQRLGGMQPLLSFAASAKSSLDG